MRIYISGRCLTQVYNSKKVDQEEGAGPKSWKIKISKSRKKGMAQGMENTVSNGQGSKPHSAIEKGDIKTK